MTFVKVLKNKAYFKRYQTKYRRRREGKTDYKARRTLVKQDKDKYNLPKYRLCVRRTNKKVSAQIFYSTIAGDREVCAADSRELSNYGIPVGHTNYAAAYATGLLLARRQLKRAGLDKSFDGVAKPTGEEFHVEEDADEQRPFKCILDVGLTRCTTGNRLFGIMKGAVDGGLYIPHSVKRFPGFARGEKGGADGNYDAETHRKRIMGEHVKQYMEELKDDDPERYASQFSQFTKHKITSDNIVEMYEKGHAAIRANPERKKKERQHEPMAVREGTFIRTSKARYSRPPKLTPEERKERASKKIQLFLKSKLAELEEGEE